MQLAKMLRVKINSQAAAIITNMSSELGHNLLDNFLRRRGSRIGRGWLTPYFL